MPYVSGETRRRVLIWLAGSVAFCLLLLAGVAYVGYRWLAYTGRQVPVDSVVDANTVALLHFEGDLRDPGVSALLNRASSVLTEIARARGNALPPMSATIMAHAGEQVLPREMALSYRTVPGGDLELVAAVNFRGFARLMGIVAGGILASRSMRGVLQVTKHNGYDLIGDSPVLCPLNGTLLIAGSRDGMRAAVNRLGSDTAPAPVPTWEREELQALSRTHACYGVIDNRDGVLRKWLVDGIGASEATAARLSDRIRRLDVGCSILSADALRVTANLRCQGTSQVLADVRSIVEGLAEKMAQVGLELRFSARVQDEYVVAEVGIRCVEQALDRWKDLMKREEQLPLEGT